MTPTPSTAIAREVVEYIGDLYLDWREAERLRDTMLRWEATGYPNLDLKSVAKDLVAFYDALKKACETTLTTPKKPPAPSTA